MPILKARDPAQTRNVVCTNCEHVNEVPTRAMSVFCPQCKKRLILENYKIKGYYAVNDFATCGDIVVERRGFVVAPIKVENLTVKGKLQGQVTARGKVSIGKTGWFKGDVVAPRLQIKSGAVVEGFMRIG
ncbi:MAG: polymer-forming cytoskeletal protein [Planctomycetes bacterium]|nr:polymer-forming cytoskeletal protein [Planctomycetota bacterium]MCH7871299.1 polymer-forming cytoskeletal protein [Planctomycetota bacterium]